MSNGHEGASDSRAKDALGVKPLDEASPETPHPQFDPGAIRRLFETGEFPYRTAMPSKLYDEHMVELQRELLKAQRWVQDTGQRVITLFEGRDAAGKADRSSGSWST